MKTFITSFAVLSLFFVTGCSGGSQALTKEQQAEKYNVSMDKMDEMSSAAARMNMTLEEHMKTLQE